MATKLNSITGEPFYLTGFWGAKSVTNNVSRRPVAVRVGVKPIAGANGFDWSGVCPRSWRAEGLTFVCGCWPAISSGAIASLRSFRNQALTTKMSISWISASPWVATGTRSTLHGSPFALAKCGSVPSVSFALATLIKKALTFFLWYLDRGTGKFSQSPQGHRVVSGGVGGDRGHRPNRVWVGRRTPFHKAVCVFGRLLHRKPAR
jgi:hypothetical protein